MSRMHQSSANHGVKKHQQIGSNFRLHFAALHMIGKGQNQAPESIGCTVSSPRNGMASPRHDSLTPQQMISEKEEDIVLQENHLPNITTKSMSLSDRLKLARTAHENRDAFYILSSAWCHPTDPTVNWEGYGGVHRSPLPFMVTSLWSLRNFLFRTIWGPSETLITTLW